LSQSARHRSLGKKASTCRKKIGRTQRERTDATTAKIMAATRDCIFELGWAGATMSAIARRAGVTRGALQHHYGSRANLFKALIDHFFDSLAQFEESTVDINSEKLRKAFFKESFRIYGTALPVAIMQLRINAQAEPELRDIVESKFLSINSLRDKVWDRLFHLAGLSNEETQLIREIVYAILRGFAVRQAYRRKTAPIDVELAIVTEMVELYIARHAARASSSPLRSRRSDRVDAAE
jgi:AcrR family transcriptional regulator